MRLSDTSGVTRLSHGNVNTMTTDEDSEDDHQDTFQESSHIDHNEKEEEGKDNSRLKEVISSSQLHEQSTDDEETDVPVRARIQIKQLQTESKQSASAKDEYRRTDTDTEDEQDDVELPGVTWNPDAPAPPVT